MDNGTGASADRDLSRHVVKYIFYNRPPLPTIFQLIYRPTSRCPFFRCSFNVTAVTKTFTVRISTNFSTSVCKIRMEFPPLLVSLTLERAPMNFDVYPLSPCKMLPSYLHMEASPGAEFC